MCLINAIELTTIKGARVIPVDQDGYILWHIREDKLTPDMDKMKLVMAFENGFKILEREFYPIQFKSTSDKSKAPIIIGFFNNGDDDLPETFTPDTLAYAFGNYSNFKYASDMFFNDSFPWAEMNTEKTYNLTKTFVHECMHALGFEHSDIKNDILYWQYQPNDEINFSQDTKDAILKYYKVEMDKVPGKSAIVKESEKLFLKTIINFKLFGLTLNESTIISICKFFGIKYGRSKKDNYKLIVKYLDA